MTKIPFADYGIPTVQTEEFTTVELFAGDTPHVVTDTSTVPEALATAGIPAWTPVFVDPATRVVSLAVYDADPGDAVVPNAITVATVQPGSPADTSMPVYKAGCFNIRALNWPASFDSNDKKFAAFASATDAQIYIKEPYGQ